MAWHGKQFRAMASASTRRQVHVEVGRRMGRKIRAKAGSGGASHFVEGW